MNDSGLDLSSDGDRGSNEAEKQSCLSKGKYLLWEPVDKQRLLAYKIEGKSWDYISRKFEGRTEAAIRTRWTMVQRKVK